METRDERRVSLKVYGLSISLGTNKMTFLMMRLEVVVLKHTYIIRKTEE